MHRTIIRPNEYIKPLTLIAYAKQTFQLRIVLYNVYIQMLHLYIGYALYSTIHILRYLIIN